ncbi:MAG: IS66 family transposase, partial [Acetobacteraceae bacterium]|nr:IS66 family transposase [Acetobacteraceae bacterium]
MSLPPSSPPTPPLTADDLPDDVGTLKQMVLELAQTVCQERQDKEVLQHRLQLLVQRLYGRRSERLDPNQRLLFDPPEALADASPPPAALSEETSRPKRRCRPHGRRRLLESLPRESRHYALSEAERLCGCCGQLRVEIGVDKSEQLEYRPASLRVIEHLIHKYACPCCGRQAAATPGRSAGALGEVPVMSAAEGPAPPAQSPQPSNANAEPYCPNSTAAPSSPSATPVVVAARKPAQPIPKGLPGPGLLAHLIVSKWVDHLPLHRLERVYERQGLVLSRSTLCDWLAACAQLLQPLYQRLVEVVLQSRVLHTDDTTVKLQDVATHQLSTARLWVYLGDWAHPYNVFDFTRTRQRDGPQQFLRTYQGYLQADAFSGYDALYLPDPQTSQARIVEVACNAHARRKFYEARTSDVLRAHTALGYYRSLYALERAAAEAELTEEGKRQMRQELALPLWEQFHTWLERQRAEVLPKSPLGEALRYALNNWSALVRYTEAGYLAIDNNAAEREMKRIAIGRKNWLFVGSPRGGQTAAVLVSFTSTCARLGVEPWAYLQDVLGRLPTTPADRLGELLPDRWQAAQPRPSVPPGLPGE